MCAYVKEITLWLANIQRKLELKEEKPLIKQNVYDSQAARKFHCSIYK